MANADEGPDARTRAVAAAHAGDRAAFESVMRQYERGRDGTWQDGMLMDLLAGELLRV